MPVGMLSPVYLFICQMLWVPSCIETTVDLCYDKFSIYFGYLLCVICRLLQAKSHMPTFICRIPCASYSHISLHVNLSTSFHMLCVKSRIVCMPIFICRHMSAKSFLRVAKLAYMSNCYISVCMPSALFYMLYAECYVLYAKLHMLDCNMPNAMTIAMFFSMTAWQVGHLIIYICIYYPAITLHIAVTEKRLLLYHYGFNLYLESQVFQFVSTSGYLVITWVTCISVCRHIMSSIKISNHRLFRFASISRHQSITHIAVYFGMLAYHSIL
jgi:hypothetical protein